MSLACLGHRLAGISLGFIVGLGYIAAWVKFSAKNPDMLDLLDVGRVQFSALHTAEWILVPLTCGLVATGGKRDRILAILTLGFFFVKALGIQPVLHQHMIARLRGELMSGLSPHLPYVVVSSLMVLSLLALAMSRESNANLD